MVAPMMCEPARDDHDCDFLVIGAGSAGCVVARVLAESGRRVRLVEAGPARSPSRRPADYVSAFHGPEDWDFQSVAQVHLAGRRIDQPRGHGPGGSTRINAMIWYPPRKVDLDMLARHGGTPWAPQQLLASLQRITRWVNPQRPSWLSPAVERFCRLRTTAIEPPHPFARMTAAGARRTAADLLQGIDAIDLVQGTAQRILFDDRATMPRALGAQVCLDGHRHPSTLTARGGVILAAGAIQSPAILLRSGIGPADTLRYLDNPKRCENPAVGLGLADHLIMPVVFALPPQQRFPQRFSVADLARWQHAGVGPASSNLAEAGAIFALPPRQAGGEPVEFQLHVTPTHYLLHPSSKAPAAMTIGVNLCRPRSRGRLWVVPDDPSAATGIDPGYLSDPRDLDDLVAAVQAARQLAGQPPLAAGQELVPGSRRTSDHATQQATRRLAQSLYHPTSTCRMAADGSGVVDADCRVVGSEGLYVIDASVLPKIPSINPNATVMMIAHHAAKRLADRS